MGEEGNGGGGGRNCGDPGMVPCCESSPGQNSMERSGLSSEFKALQIQLSEASCMLSRVVRQRNVGFLSFRVQLEPLRCRP